MREVAMLLRDGRQFSLAEAVGLTSAGQGAITLPATSSAVRRLSSSRAPAPLYREAPDGRYLLAGAAEQQVLDHLNAGLLLPFPGRDTLMRVMTLGPKRSEAP